MGILGMEIVWLFWCSGSKFKLAGAEALQETDSVLSMLIIRSQFQKTWWSFIAYSSYVNGADDDDPDTQEQ